MTAVPTATKDQSPPPLRANGHPAAESKPPPPALPVDLATLSDDVIAALAAEASGEIARRKAKREADFFELVRERAALLGVTPARLAAAIAGKSAARVRASGTDGRRDVKPLYRNPADPSQTWAGRGQPPPWIEFGNEINPKTGKPLPLAKFRIPPEGAV